jgi:tetratricopeptide (TPR) repeat protein
MQKLLVECRSRLAAVLQETGRAPEAEATFNKALDLAEKLVAGFPADPFHGYVLCDVFSVWPTLESGRFQEAERACRRSLATAETLAAKFPSNSRWHFHVALIQHHLGEVLCELSRPQEAEQAYRRAQAVLSQLVSRFPAVAEYSEWLALCHGNLAELFTIYPEAKYRNPDEALKQAQRAVELRPDIRQGWNALGIARYRRGDWKSAVTALEKSVELGKGGFWFDWFFLAMAHWQLGHKEEARKWYDQAIRWLEREKQELSRKKPQEAQYRRYRAEAAEVHDFGSFLQTKYDPKEAEQHFAKAAAIWEKLVAEFPSDDDYRLQLGNTLWQLADRSSTAGRHDEAAKTLRRALGVFEKLAADFPREPNHRVKLGHSLWQLANVSAGLGRHAEAEKLHRQALGVFEKLAADFPSVAFYQQEQGFSYWHLGWLMKNSGRSHDAEEPFRRALKVYAKLATEFPNEPEYQTRLSRSYYELSAVLRAEGKYAEAERTYSKSLELAPNPALYQNNLAWLLATCPA